MVRQGYLFLDPNVVVLTRSTVYQQVSTNGRRAPLRVNTHRDSASGGIFQLKIFNELEIVAVDFFQHTMKNRRKKSEKNDVQLNNWDEVFEPVTLDMTTHYEQWLHSLCN